MAAFVFGGDWLKERQRSRPAPSARRLAQRPLYRAGYRAGRSFEPLWIRRPTTPALERLAKQGIRFDAARATAPWTLPSHASFFTGRWPHELEVEWVTPLRKNYPMLAEYLGEHGYATAGLVSNTVLLLRHGHEPWFHALRRLYAREAQLFADVRHCRGSRQRPHCASVCVTTAGSDEQAQALVRTTFQYSVRRDAGSINRGFLNWLDRRREPGRPFFVFLNYLDAHTPYKVPSDDSRRFGRKPQTHEEIWIIYEQVAALEKLQLPRHYLTMARDCYDSCLAYSTRSIGRLWDDLDRRGVLENTLIVITSDHGEGFGEHDLFDHGESLYSQEIHVPLLIVPPKKTPMHRVVAAARQSSRFAGNRRRSGRPSRSFAVPRSLADGALDRFG